MNTIKSLLLVALTVFAVGACAQETIKEEMAKKYPEVKIEKITKTAYGNLYEVFAGGEIFYTDEKANFLLLGTLLDTQDRKSVV